MILEGVIQRIGERRVVAMLLTGGAIMRVAFLLLGHGLVPFTRHESARVAVSLATRGEFADAFGPGTGLTAHVGWAVVAVPAAIYRLLGPQTPVAEAVLAGIMTTVVLTSFWLCYLCLRELEVPARARLVALAALCLVPFQVSLEATELRVWEAGYAALALTGLLLAALRLDNAARRPSLPALIVLGIAVAAIEVLSPAAGLAAAAILGLLLVRRVRWAQWPAVAAGTLIVYVALTTPWKLRNEQVFGERVGSRTSLGIALAISNYHGVLDAPSRHSSYMTRFAEISPNRPSGLARMRSAGGEVAYARQLTAEAKAWIRSHPGQAARVWACNIVNFYLPPPWLWHRFAARPTGPDIVASALLSTLSLAGLSTLAVMLWRRRWRYLYPAATVIVASAPYVISFPLLRYRYPISSILASIGVAGLVAATIFFAGKLARGQAASAA